jgi:hypothetical protein
MMSPDDRYVRPRSWATDRGPRLGTDDVPAFGQIVCTLTSQFETGTVTFTSNGEPLSVPRGDASLADGPVTIADYVGLLAS